MNASSKQELLIKKTIITRIWERMTGIYTYRWTSVMGSTPFNEKGEFTGQAESWVRGLTGIKIKLIDAALDKLNDAPNASGFMIDLDAFKAMCLLRDDLPTPEQCIPVLANAPYKQGSIVDRYQHPLIFAIRKHQAFNPTELKTASQKQALAMVKRVHALVISEGFAEFLESDYIERQALSAPVRVIDEKPIKERTAAMWEKIREAEPPKKPVAALNDAPVDDTIPKAPPVSEHAKKRLIEMYGEDRVAVLLSQGVKHG